jgi:hypothetical protein
VEVKAKGQQYGMYTQCKPANSADSQEQQQPTSSIIIVYAVPSSP